MRIPRTILILLLTLAWTPALCQEGRRDVRIRFRCQDGAYSAEVRLGGWDSPLTVPLGEGVDNLGTDCGIYSKDGSFPVYESVWKPLEPLLKKGDRIWYQADGRLHFINLDAVVGGSGKRLFESYAMRRVSSVADLPKPERKAKYYSPTPIVYGGMDYKADFEDMGRCSQWVHTKHLQRHVADLPGWNLSEITFGRAEDGTRAGFTYLRFSREEVKYIDHLFPDAKVCSGMRAMEELFRFDTRSPEDYLMHISTHSFYVASYSDSSAAGLSHDQIEKRRYGLLFTGAGHTIEGSKMPYGMNDGFLYGEEIETLDMSRCDLLVLAACGTALGRVTQEGIVGLQGSFRKAGARTMLMTLWCVNDVATAQFMKHFYRSLSKGFPKDECLRRARREMMRSEEFSDPVYWAAFVMVD